MYASDYLEKNFLNVMNNITFHAPSDVYIALFLSNPGETGDQGVEVSYTEYERQLITFSEPTEYSGGLGIGNDSVIKFPKAGRDAGTATHVGFYDSSVGGNMLAYAKLTEDLIIETGESPVLREEEVILYSIGDLSVAYKKKILNILRKSSIEGVQPYIALFNGSPDEGGRELTGGNYKRMPLSLSTPENTGTGATIIRGNEEVLFPTPSTEWGTFTHVVIYDKESTGEPIWIAEKGTKHIKKGYTPIFSAEDIQISID